MKNKISHLSWRNELENVNADSIGQDFILLGNENSKNKRYFWVNEYEFDIPFKIDAITIILCICGEMRGKVDLKKYATEAPCLFIVLPDQILQYEHVSKDFKGDFIIMSKQFSNDLLLNIHERFPLVRSIQDNSWIPLTVAELESMMDYYSMLKKTVQMDNNPHRTEIIKHLVQAFFYSSSYHFQKKSTSKKQSKHDLLMKRFLDLVKMNYKSQRGVEFYADELCLTPKYLSKVLKQNSDKSASEWINDSVILEAKALLRSTNMTIQQISDELNFPSQSFFGKYFKRRVGVSPKQYRSI
ncbi:MAG TPA: helix-turn-helix domain-containing protein [Bacteroidales bacterium]|nr:helix-turn-helix domain-containing protein [Bacteroidales bacterium]